MGSVDQLWQPGQRGQHYPLRNRNTSRPSAYEESVRGSPTAHPTRAGTRVNQTNGEDYKALSSQLQWLYFDVKCRQHGKPKRTITHSRTPAHTRHI